MATISARVKDRMTAGIKRFLPILTSAKTRDVNESDTVTIVTDMLAEIFGFDKYSEITSEYVIRGTYVDLAIKLDGKLQLLIEVKAIGLDLKDAYVKQSVDYAANQGIEWVILTNGAKWQIYKVTFGKPVNQDLVIEIDFMNINPKSATDMDSLYLLTKEGIGRSVLGDYHTQRQALSRFFIGAIVLSDPVLEVVRRELRRMSPDVKIDTQQIKDVILQEIFKREVIEGEKADEARRKIARSVSRGLRKTVAKEVPASITVETPAIEPEAIASPAVT